MTPPQNTEQPLTANDEGPPDGPKGSISKATTHSLELTMQPKRRTDLWTLSEAAHHLGVTASWLRTQRKKDNLPAATVHPTPSGRRDQWDPSVLRAWYTSQQQPPNTKTRADILTTIGRATLPATPPLPPPDGRTNRTDWWQHDTIDHWHETYLAEQRRRDLWDQPTIERRTNRTWKQLSELISWTDFPEPITHTPKPLWEGQAITAWWRAHLRAAKQTWDTKTVAAKAGLSWDTVRTYRRIGRLPLPDGMDGVHPWWWPETIEAWIACRRRTITTGRPPNAQSRQGQTDA